MNSARRDDPYAPSPFLRPPLFTWLVRHCGGRNANELLLRLMMICISATTVAVATAAGWRLGGPLAGALVAALLIVHPENMLLSCHVWPDVLLALPIAILDLLVITGGDGDRHLLALGAGIVCAAGTHARIDFIVVPPVFCASLAASGIGLDPLAAVLILAPTAAGLILYSIRNYRRYGIPLPDTTWAFNLMVSEAEILPDNPTPDQIAPTVSDVALRWHELGERAHQRRGPHFFRAVAGHPRHFCRAVTKRLWTMVGPDTFVRQLLLRNPLAYPDTDERIRRALEPPLVWASPFLFTFVAASELLQGRWPPPYAWPGFVLLLPAALFFARTRYRIAVLPTVALLAAEGAMALPAIVREPRATQVLVLLATAAALWVLVRFVPRVEVSG